MKKNSVFMACSLDGYIADKQGGIEWLHDFPNPEDDDLGYSDFISKIDAVVMGRKSFETVLSFDMDWPYTLPVFVLSHMLRKVPSDLEGKVHLLGGPVKEVVAEIHEKGYHRLYIDGGKSVQNFLKADLIDEMIITRIPKLLGGGTPLFGELSRTLDFQCIGSKIYLDAIVQNVFKRKRQN